MESPTIPAINDSPAEFSKYALLSGGNLTINGKFVTKGVLSDVHSNQTITLNSYTSRFSGNVTSYEKLQSLGHTPRVLDGNTLRGAGSKVLLDNLMTVDIKMADSNLQNAIVLASDCSMTILDEEGRGSDATSQDVDGDWSCHAGNWSVSGHNVIIQRALSIEGNLEINSTSFVLRAPLFSRGSVAAHGAVRIDINNPFEDAVIINEDLTTEGFDVVGKIHVNGDFNANGAVYIVGSAMVGGDVTLHKEATINYLDTIYKAALAKANEQFEETLLVHSQVFRDVSSDKNNAVALFTFVNGYRYHEEGELLEMVRAGTANPDDYFSVIIGANQGYASELAHTEYLLPYYANQVKLFDDLKAQGHDQLHIVDAINLPMNNFYLTLSDGDQELGTWQVYGNPELGEKVGKHVKLTDENIEAARISLKNQGEQVAQRVADANAMAEELGLKALDEDEFDLSDDERARSEAMQGKSDELLRIEEWRAIKEMEEELVEVDVMPVSPDSLSTGPVTNGWLSKAWNKIKKKVKKIIPRCKKKWRDNNFIAGVNPYSRNDFWMNNISLKNNWANNCGPIAGLAIARYHGTRISKYAAALAPAATTADKRNVNIKGVLNPDLKELRKFMRTSSRTGTMMWNFSSGLEKYLGQKNVSGKKVRWLWYDAWITNSTFSIAGWNPLYSTFNSEVKANRPPAVYTYGLYLKVGNKRINGGHIMPVLGTKKKVYYSLCYLTPTKHYVYVDTEWDAGKVWMRMDRWAYWFQHFDGIKIKVW